MEIVQSQTTAARNSAKFIDESSVEKVSLYKKNVSFYLCRNKLILNLEK